MEDLPRLLNRLGPAFAALLAENPRHRTPRASPASGRELPSPDVDGHPLRAGDVVAHVNDHGSPTVAVGYRGRFIRLANPTLSQLTGGIRTMPGTGMVLMETRVREGAHAGKVVICSPKAIRLTETPSGGPSGGPGPSPGRVGPPGRAGGPGTGPERPGAFTGPAPLTPAM